MGAAFSLTALVLTGLGYWTAAVAVLGLLIAAATLESAFGICLGCITFGMLMRAGYIPHEVCERCDDMWGEHAPASKMAA
jgi:Domain of unknown function (DUF4395)